jgi:hypothetical protein
MCVIISPLGKEFLLNAVFKILTNIYQKKVKGFLSLCTKDDVWHSGGNAPYILNIGTRRLRPLYPRHTLDRIPNGPWTQSGRCGAAPSGTDPGVLSITSNLGRGPVAWLLNFRVLIPKNNKVNLLLTFNCTAVSTWLAAGDCCSFRKRHLTIVCAWLCDRWKYQLTEKCPKPVP